MKISTIGYFISDAFKSLKRNTTISIASILTVFATLFVFGVFLLAGLNVSQGIKDVESKVQVKVFLKDDINMMDQREIETKLKDISGAKEVKYEDKSQGLKNLKEQFKNRPEILKGFDESNNPLLNCFVVTLESTEAAPKVETTVKGMTGLDEVVNDQELINKIASFAKTIKWVGVGLFAVLIGVSLFLIVNTIKLTVYSRRREVGIMKFVGATDWFIRWPFIIEGVVIGVLGAVVSNVALFFGYKGVYGWITKTIYTIQLVDPMYVLTTMSWQFILAGMFIGVFGSIIALRKFLVV
ncbi:cell division protein FtsX [Clostridium cavendishii DSM 21758]|uniref:Cell division protein FtsX n=1 Tax=Clostridium cavendishii DSM 21758 TaxID=1121302 RepID=A0A1M6TV09_9CLOT|nr:permease-like cell division protein FtsX [Clostridium cavendishii]SHK60730.1 cell division protein FtsX [Clostridium cavendishii DSM 21758]